jgi:hypothetical protein
LSTFFHSREEVRLSKKAVIVIRLVEESIGKANAEIEKDILEELSKGEPKIPWFKSVEKVMVTEES